MGTFVDRRSTLGVAAVCVAEVAVVVVATLSPAADATADGGAWTTIVTTLALVGALALIGSALLVQATRTVRGTARAATTGPTVAGPSGGVVLVGFATYVSVTPIGRLLIDDATAWTVGRCVQILALVGAAHLLVTRGRAARRVHVGVLAVAVVPAAVLVTPALGVWVPAGTTHLVVETGLAAGWTIVALALARRADHGAPATPALSLATLVGPLHVLCAADGAAVGATTAVGAALLSVIAADHLRRSWSTVAREADEIAAELDRAHRGAHLEAQLVAQREAHHEARPASQREATRDAERRTSSGVNAHDVRNACATVRLAADLLCSEQASGDPASSALARRALAGGVAQIEHLVAR
jgi:hypothetical protein